MTTTSGENQAAESGIDLAALDPQVRPQDDFFRAINGRWLDEFEIPEDKAQYASFTALHDVAEEQLHEIITELSDGVDLTALDADGKPQDPATQVAILFADFMDTDRLDAAGTAPLAPLLDRIASVESAADLPRVFGDLTDWGLALQWVPSSTKTTRTRPSTCSTFASPELDFPTATSTSRRSSRTSSPPIATTSLRCGSSRAGAMKRPPPPPPPHGSLNLRRRSPRRHGTRCAIATPRRRTTNSPFRS